MSQSAIVIIPARYASHRLPGKPLLQLSGQTMIERVYRRAQQIEAVDDVIVATDDSRIYDAVNGFGGKVVMTPKECRNGSERVGGVAKSLSAEIIVNLQGDEPLFPCEPISAAINALREDDKLNVATLGGPLLKEQDWQNPSVVKVVLSANDMALYFSRAPVPWPRDDTFKPSESLLRHIGVYVYRRHFLLQLLDMPECELEKIEKLEQLRILYNGQAIKVLRATSLSPGVDTPEDIAVVEQLINEKGLSL